MVWERWCGLHLECPVRQNEHPLTDDHEILS
jgi:hypothetical protein